MIQTQAHEQDAHQLLELTQTNERETHEVRQEAHQLLELTQEHEKESKRLLDLAQIHEREGVTAPRPSIGRSDTT